MAIRMKFSKITMGTVSVTGISTDGTMAGNSDALIPTQKAVRTYIASVVSGDITTGFISVIATPTEGNFPTITAGGELATSAYGPTDFAAADHDHDSDYATADHNHDGDYIGATGAATGDMLYYNGSAWIQITVGSSGDVLTLVGTVPTWVTPTP